MNQNWKKIFIFPLVVLIKGYQMFISPFLGANCRFQPTCSAYMLEALNTFGFWKGLWKGIIRISKCHPWGGSGHDPVIKEN